MKVYAYRMVRRGPREVADLLAGLNRLPLRERVFEPRSGGMRLETAVVRGDYLFADFSKDRRGHGPGRRSADHPVREFDMAQGEQFAEDTAMLYDPATRHVAVQYNHQGPRIGSIQKYLFAADASMGGGRALENGEAEEDRYGFGFGAVLKPDALARLRGLGIYRTIEFSVSVPGAREGDLQAGRSLSSVLNAPLPEGIETLRIVMSAAADRNSALGEGGVMGIVNDLQRLGPAVKHAMVGGRNRETGVKDEVDLVEDRLVKDIPVRIGHGLRFVREDRWDALETAYTQWTEEALLPRRPG